MPITGFDFPGVTFRQEYATTPTGGTQPLSVVCVGPQFNLHDADSANAAKISQTTTLYNSTTGLTVQALPGRSSTGILDTDAKAQHLVVKNGVYSYNTFTGAPALVGASGLKFSFTVKDGNGDMADVTRFGVRGVRVGDPIVITGNTTVIAQVLNVIPSVSGGSYDTIVIASGYIAQLGTITSVQFCEYADVKYDGGSSVFSISDSGVLTINGGITTVLSDMSSSTEGTLVSGVSGTPSCDLYIEYREFVKNYVGKLGSVESREDIEAELGPIVVDNPLAITCFGALRGGSGMTVYFTGVRTNDLAGYQEALDFLDDTNTVYSVVPCTLDADIIKDCSAHCVSVSDNEESTIRRACWYGIDSAENLTLFNGSVTFAGTDASSITVSDVVYTYSAASSGASYYAWTSESEATVYTAARNPIADDPVYSNSALTTSAGTVAAVTGFVAGTATFPENVFSDYPLQDGDIVKVGSTEYSITATNDLNVATLAVVPAVGSFTAKLIRTEPTNADYIADLIAKRQARSQSERAQCVWADVARYNGEVLPNYVLAASAAGMRAYEPCQRPLSNLGYDWFTVEEPHGFTKSQLRQLGANGIWIVANNDDGTPINKRQITTAVSNNLNKDEESIIANADTIALDMMQIGRDMVGCSNISPNLIELLGDTIKSRLDRYLLNETGSVYIGPQLLSCELVAIYQDPVNLDRVYAEFEVEPPKPFNKFHMVMRVI